jgi:hypothetical protein
MTAEEYLANAWFSPHVTNIPEVAGLLDKYALKYANEQNKELYGIIDSQHQTAEAMGKRLVKYEDLLKWIAEMKKDGIVEKMIDKVLKNEP